MPPRCGCRLAVADEAFLDNAQFIIIRPIPAAFTIGSRQNFDLRAVDKVGHKVGLTIGANPRSDGRPRRLTSQTCVCETMPKPIRTGEFSFHSPCRNEKLTKGHARHAMKQPKRRILHRPASDPWLRNARSSHRPPERPAGRRGGGLAGSGCGWPL